MNVHIVLAHPEQRSFNAALVETAVAALDAAGHAVTLSDLYRMGFDPVSDRRNFLSVKDPHYLKLQVEEAHASEIGGFVPEIEAELEKLEACDLLILQFPLWWFGLPAILKGWVDRVFAMGRVYGGGRVYANGRFRGKRALVSVTTGGPADAYVDDGFNGDIHAILRPIHRGMLQFVGFDVLAPQIHYGPVRVDDARRAAWLEAHAARLRGIAGESPIEVGRY
ncbi:MAG: NAD(P)H-dependent oxidoreductase [Burkholderiaceae bacterium]